MDSLKKEQSHTSEEFLAMTDLEGRYGLVDGCIYDMSPSPGIEHQNIVGGIFYEIKNYIKRNNGRCKPFVSPSDVRLDNINTIRNGCRALVLHPFRLWLSIDAALPPC